MGSVGVEKHAVFPAEFRDARYILYNSGLVVNPLHGNKIGFLGKRIFESLDVKNSLFVHLEHFDVNVV